MTTEQGAASTGARRDDGPPTPDGGGRSASLRDALDAIRRASPTARLLRAPEGFGPIHASGGGDLDILVPSDDADAVASALRERGFEREPTPQTFRLTFRRRLLEEGQVATVDVYTEMAWGAGVTHPDGVPDPATARFLRDLFDHDAVPEPDALTEGVADGLGLSAKDVAVLRRLLEIGARRSVKTYLLLRADIEVDLETIASDLWQRLTRTAKRLRYKRGAEVGLIGVDGAGKTSLADTVEDLPLPVKVVYMGNSPTLRLTQLVGEKDPLASLRVPVSHLDKFARRLQAWFMARRGWLVVYDRHPVEGKRVEGGWKATVNNLLAGLYGWPVDTTYHLKGDPEVFHDRKPEHSPSALARMQEEHEALLRIYSEEVRQLEASEQSLGELREVMAEDLLAAFHRRNGRLL